MTKKEDDTAALPEDTLAVAVGPQDPELLYGDHLNQKFGNTPANPKHPGGLSEPSVVMEHITNNMDGSVGSAFKTVPKELVGDYARAGWSVAGPTTGTGDAIGPGAGYTGDKAGEKLAAFNAKVDAGDVVIDPPATV